MLTQSTVFSAKYYFLLRIVNFGISPQVTTCIPSPSNTLAVYLVDKIQVTIIYKQLKNNNLFIGMLLLYYKATVNNQMDFDS